MGRFQKKIVIVTGASSGIGEATAIAFAKEGANLTITGRNKERLTATAKICKELGAEVLEIVGDLTKFDNLEPLINKTAEKFGAIDVLINNAGYGALGTIEQMDVDRYENMLQANLRAPVFLSKYALPHLKKTKGCIVNVSSCAGLRARAGNVTYGMTKAALDHFTRGFSAETASFGVTVNSVNPAAVETRFGEKLGIPDGVREQMVKEFMKKQPFGFIKSEDIADAILFLCSSRMITGVSLPVDAGYLNGS